MQPPPEDTNTTLDQALAYIEAELAGCDLGAMVLKLKKRFPSATQEVLALAAEIAASRPQAAEKLGAWAASGFISRAVLEQSSRSAVATWRASLFSGCSHVLEIGTGSGCDTAALARVSQHVTTVESDPATSELARRNLEVLGLSNVTFLVGSAQDIVPAALSSCDALFADPARRRRDGERVKDAEDYSPPLSWILSLALPRLCAIKVSPGLFVEPCPDGWTRQFVGVGSECLEQTLWRGAPIADSSVVLPDCGAQWSPPVIRQPAELASELRGSLLEAHAVVNRSQFLSCFLAQHGARLVDEDVAYGVAESLPAASPFLARFRILEEFPFQPKQLKTRLKQRGWTNRTEFKKRSMQLDPEEVRREMRLPEHSHDAPFGVVFLFPWRGKPWSVLAERLCD